MKSMGILILCLVFVLIFVFVKGDDWTNCPTYCSCKWVTGKKAANCENKALNFIPKSLSSEIQTIDLSENQIGQLPDNAFSSVNLTSLMKINVRNCQINEISIDALKGLYNLFELDLSENKIHTLLAGTFGSNTRLKTLILNNNPLEKVPANLFHLNHLSKLELQNCRLKEIDEGAFDQLNSLTHLQIENNSLTYINVNAFRNLMKLNNFYFYDNPWHCDCHLRNLRDWVLGKNLHTVDTKCFTPDRLRDKIWKKIQPNDFACKPEIMWPPPGKSITPENSNVVLTCKASGDPLPQVHWVHNSRIISEDTTIKYNANRYTINTQVIDEDGPRPSKWINLTVHDVNVLDKGQYKCIAESPGGSDEMYIALLLDGEGGGVVEVAGYNIESWPLIIGLATGLTALFIIIIILICCFCCRYKQTRSSKASVTNSDKQDESLLAVNPIQKPPRSYDTQVSPDEGVELSELNTKLLDENSLNGTVCTSDGNRSAECLVSNPEDRQDSYPPDLLSFPPRRYNASPAGSAKGFDPFSGRPVLTPLSPGVHSLPPHRYNFGTLPYSRSHSPLSPGLPVVLPRQGYVTIPRRPRIPSWSSAPTPSLLDDPLAPILAEPVYDNLGPRTTADGSSVLSLNKAIPENPRKKLPTQRPYYFHYDSPCPSPLVIPDRGREEFKKPIVTNAEPGATTPVKKIAPKPPPKPKKGGPLFEDEGEDGTEV